MSGRDLKFFYFDLGNVLLHFDHQRAVRQMAELSGVSAKRVWEVVFESDLHLQYEAGEMTTEEFHDEFSRRTSTTTDLAEMCLACSDIFELNKPLAAIVEEVKSSGHRLGILSNTNAAHWEFVFDGRYPLLREGFGTFALSFELKSLKPDPAIYRAAADLAGTPPDEIFFVDDRPENVEGARAGGFDAVQFTTAARLAGDLRARGIPIQR